MIFLFTDFGLEGPYTGQVQAVLRQQAPGVPVISLLADLVPFEIQSAAYLLAAYSSGFPPGSVFLCVVDPGVGGARPGAVVRADGRWYVGPDEGLFAILARRARRVECWQLPHPVTASPSFHARDVFAPLAARLARDGAFGAGPVATAACARLEWPTSCSGWSISTATGMPSRKRAPPWWPCSHAADQWPRRAPGPDVHGCRTRGSFLVREFQRAGGTRRQPGQGGPVARHRGGYAVRIVLNPDFDPNGAYLRGHGSTRKNSEYSQIMSVFSVDSVAIDRGLGVE